MQLLRYSPRLDLETATLLAERIYALRAAATPLPSERDQNFLLTTKTGRKFVLKIANALEERALLEAQNQVMTYLSTRLTFCPRVVPTVSGAQMEQVVVPGGSSHFVRLITSLPGVPLGEVEVRSPELSRNLGRKLGQLDHALADFDHPAIHRDFHWDLANGIRTVHEYAPLVADTKFRNLIEQCADKFEREVGPLLHALRRSVVHGDANDFNVLVSEGELEPERRQVVGLIDFGDMVHSYTAGELAVAIAYMLLDQQDPLAAAEPVIAGYHREYPLRENEIESLWGLTLMRLLMSVCLAAHQQQQQPGNPYLKISQSAITNSLPKLAAIDWRRAMESFQRATKAPASSLDRLSLRSSLRDTLDKRRRLLGRNLTVAYREPVKIVRAS